MRPAIKISLLSALACAMAAQPARAQNQGFALNRYEPTAAGEWSFAVAHPWFSSSRYFAAGLTLNYAHKPFVLGVERGGSFSEQRDIISHQLITHVDVAGSLFDRVLLAGSLPVVWVTRSESVDQGVAVGDPRIGLVGRIFGQPYRQAFSVSAGLDVWIPLRSFTNSLADTASDQSARVLPRVMLGGVWQKLLWSATFGFLYRPEAVAAVSAPGFPAGEVGRVGSELQFGFAASYFNQQYKFAVGPELLLSTTAIGKDSFSRFGTSLEMLLAGHYNIAGLIQTGLALGFGFVREPGTPDFRLLARIAYAPTRKKVVDTDRDGIPDREDACPQVAGIRTGAPATNGCPPADDRDFDGVPNISDFCPDTHMGSTPDETRLGCPLAQSESDRDFDGVRDRDDACPDTPQGALPDPTRRGCPAQDTDKDGVLDSSDYCATEPAGLNPDAARPGCPLPDRDGDQVPDTKDACPDRPGAPHPDFKKNGCPSLVEIKDGKLVILQPVFFATDKDVILPKSFPVLQAVANALKAAVTIQKLRIEGHTDNVGGLAHNMDLSNRRARSVLRWLVQNGIAANRLEALGFGPVRPIDRNNTLAGRSNNRRVEFTILSILSQ